MISRQRRATSLCTAAPPPTATRSAAKSNSAKSGVLTSALNSVLTPDIQAGRLLPHGRRPEPRHDQGRDTVACPFHDWRWGGDGRCTNARRVPPRARTRSWATLEQNGQLFVWHDPEGGPPPPEVSIPRVEGAFSPGWTDWTWDSVLVGRELPRGHQGRRSSFASCSRPQPPACERRPSVRRRQRPRSWRSQARPRALALKRRRTRCARPSASRCPAV